VVNHWHRMPADGRPQVTEPTFRFLVAYLPVLLAIAVAYLVAGASLSSLPLHLTRDLNYGADLVGLIAGTQFLFAIIGRLLAGRLSDRIGPRAVICAGLGLTSLSGAFYLVSLIAGLPSTAMLAALFGGRALMGAGEAFIITSGQAWGIALVGRDRAASAIGWAGTALFLALALGGPVGGLLYGTGGFAAVAWFTLAAPVLSLAPIYLRPALRPDPAAAIGSARVLCAVALPGLVMCLAGFCFSAMAFFSVLLAEDRGWVPPWALFTGFSCGLVAMRMGFGTLPDRVGGLRTAIGCLAAMAVSLASVGLAPSMLLGVVASVICGASYAFIYPALGRVAVRSLPAANSGSAVAFYSAFNDLALAVTNPILGLIAVRFGIGAVIGTAAASAIAGLALATFLSTRTGNAN
jgi:MFS family permease